jgi:hypothetical protein
MGTVDKETAKLEMLRFIEQMDLDLDPEEMDKESLEDWERLEAIFIKYVMSGVITVDENGEPTVHFRAPPENGPEKITFHEPTGAAWLAYDQGKRGADQQKQYLLMASICGCDSTLFGRLKQRDLKACNVVLKLFLA